MTDWPEPIDGRFTYNLADVLASIHGGPRAAQIIRQFANGDMRFAFTETYYNNLLAEAERIDHET